MGIHYDEQQLTVHVRDDGRGISPETLEAKGRAGHWGLPGMRERASKIGAQLDLRSRPEAGTEMELTIPAATAYRSRRAWGNWFSSRRFLTSIHGLSGNGKGSSQYGLDGRLPRQDLFAVTNTTRKRALPSIMRA